MLFLPWNVISSLKCYLFPEVLSSLRCYFSLECRLPENVVFSEMLSSPEVLSSPVMLSSPEVLSSPVMLSSLKCCQFPWSVVSFPETSVSLKCCQFPWNVLSFPEMLFSHELLCTHFKMKGVGSKQNGLKNCTMYIHNLYRYCEILTSSRVFWRRRPQLLFNKISLFINEILKWLHFIPLKL